MKKLNKKVPIIGGAVIGVILVIYIILCFLASGKGFIKNMTINGIKVNNMSKEEVISKLENKYQKDQNQLLLNLEMNDQKYQIDMKDNVKVNIKKQVNNIQKKYNNFFTKGYHYLLQHNENISIDIKNQKLLNKDIKKSGILDYSTLVPTTYKVEKTKVIFTKGKSGEAVKQKDVYNTIQTALNEYDFNKTLKIKPSSVSEDESVMKTIYKTLSKKGKNATLDKNNDYKIVAEQYGAKYDLDDSINAFNKAKEGKEFEVKAKAIVPSITKEDLEKNLFKDVLGEYTTTVNGSSVRKNNVRLAGEKCNVILLPGEEFSYNQTVGKRTKENGFGVIIAAAGKAAHLAGVLAAHTTLPVIGIPIKSSTLDGLDALLATVQMPSGIPVATVAIDGAANAAILAVQMLAIGDEELAKKLDAMKTEMVEGVKKKDAALQAEVDAL